MRIPFILRFLFWLTGLKIRRKGVPYKSGLLHPLLKGRLCNRLQRRTHTRE